MILPLIQSVQAATKSLHEYLQHNRQADLKKYFQLRDEFKQQFDSLEEHAEHLRALEQTSSHLRTGPEC